MISGVVLVALLSVPNGPSDQLAPSGDTKTPSVQQSGEAPEAAGADSGKKVSQAPGVDSGAESQRGSAESIVRIDLNTASVEQLTTLPGIGIKRAQAIVRRREIRRFRWPRDLLRVSGIGRRTFFRLKPLVSVSPPGDANAKERRAR